MSVLDCFTECPIALASIQADFTYTDFATSNLGTGTVGYREWSSALAGSFSFTRAKIKDKGYPSALYASSAILTIDPNTPGGPNNSLLANLNPGEFFLLSDYRNPAAWTFVCAPTAPQAIGTRTLTDVALPPLTPSTTTTTANVSMTVSLALASYYLGKNWPGPFAGGNPNKMDVTPAYAVTLPGYTGSIDLGSIFFGLGPGSGGGTIAPFGATPATNPFTAPWEPDLGGPYTFEESWSGYWHSNGIPTATPSPSTQRPSSGSFSLTIAASS